MYGGSGQGNFGGAEAAPLPIHGQSYSLNITIPPLGIVVFEAEDREATGDTKGSK
jgi:1,4-alpha-glucan branching enzyme